MRTISSCLRNYKTTYTIINSDFNAKCIGIKQDDSEFVMCSLGFCSRNSRAAMLINYPEQQKIFHRSSFFKTRLDRKWTWLFPDAIFRNEIDYMFNSHKYIVKDVTVLNNFYTGTDHRLIRAKVQIDAKLEI